MLETFLRYSQGYVAIPVVDALRRGGAVRLLEGRDALTLVEMASGLSANQGHLAVAMRLLQEIGWVDQDAHARFQLTPSAARLSEIPEDVSSLVQLPLEDYFRGGRASDVDGHAALARWLDRSSRRWDTSSAQLADWLDGVLVLPALVAASRLKLFESDRLSTLPASIRESLTRLFVARGWATAEPVQLTDLGRHFVDRALVMGVTASYAPMLRHLDALLFGDAAGVLAGHATGEEEHVDRALNVVASGFQHERYFKDIDEILIEIFDRQPLDRQPRYVADMGSGDGALLERIYRVVADRTARGRNFATHPLTLIAADFSERALNEARARLGDIPCLFIHADIGDPNGLVESLRAHGHDDPASILHVRSFLDHDRTLSPTIDLDRAAARHASTDVGCFANGAGGSVSPAHVVQDLVEHMQRWSSIVGPAGLIVLEVHSLPARAVREQIDRCENLYFDALQGFSGQLLVPAATYVMAAAEAGLFPRADHSRRYPATLPFTRITLSWLERRDFRVRHARPDDVPALVALEINTVEEGLRASEQEIRRRVIEVPDGQCVLEVDGRVAGVLYSQRIASPEVLFGRTVDDLAAMHDPAGRIVQLIGLRVDPAMQQRGLGDQFLDFVLLWLGLQSPIEAAVGVSRCRDFKEQPLPLAEYVASRGADGRAADPILRFHQLHGARIEGVVPGFCPRDFANDGHGVLIRYDFEAGRTPAKATAAVEGGSRSTPARVAADVETCVRRVLGPRRVDRFDPARPLMELGLDSLDLMELRAQIEQTLDVNLEQTFFFEYATTNAAAARLSSSPDAAPRHQGSAVPSTASPRRKRSSKSITTTAVGEPIAIVGMACRFPGGIDSAESCWNFLREGRSAVGESPATRQWAFPDVTPSFEQYPWIRHGGFLDEVAAFDAPFFNLAPREASLIDPQQRLLLEVAWEALEHAAIDPQRLAGTRSSVHIGLFSHDYELLQLRDHPQSYFDAYTATGVSAAVAAGRIAYYLGLEGPAVTVDTACSSSLVAAHLACQSLRSGESGLALVGAANLMLSPDLSIIFAKAGMLSHEGRCKSFAAGADGYVRGEGCAVLVLKRLSDALDAGDRVIALIRGSAINQDGASNGLTAPNVRAQENVVRDAIRSAGLEPADVDFIEAHGTGTSLGDPIEVEALGRVFGDRDRARPLRLGSIKTNFGHLEAAAGLAGLVKAALCLQHGELAPHLNFDAPNPLVPWHELPIEVVTSLTAMPECQVAGVSSFGFSGTNAHVILEAWREDAAAASTEPRPQVLTLSARTEPALRSLAAKVRESLATIEADAFADFCYTANRGRAHFDHRLAITCDGIDEARQGLTAFIDGSKSKALMAGRVERNTAGVAFLFTGQGSQFFGMGRELFASEPIFRSAIDACASILDPLLDVPLLQVLGYAPGGDPVLVNQTRYTQPALFAVEYALAELWRSWGVTPDVVMGHSVGEYVAACIAGVFSLEDALTLLATRSRLMQAQPAGGAMAAVMTDEATVERARQRFGDRVSIAAVNGPANIVISGESQGVSELCALLDKDGVASMPLTVSHAFHSSLMEPVLEEFEAAARKVAYSTPKIRVVSNLTGAIAGDEVCQASYWARHLRAPVQFAAGIQSAFADGARVFLELGPKPVLVGMGKRCMDAGAATWLPSLDGGAGESKRLRQSLAELYVRGWSIQWDEVDADQPHRKLTLPTYPFERERLWFEHKAHRAPIAATGNHPLLGSRLRSLSRDAEYALTIDPDVYADHRVGTDALLPAAGVVEIALAAAHAKFRDASVTVEGLSILRPLWVRSSEPLEVHALLRDTDRNAVDLELHRLSSGSDTSVDSELIATARLMTSTAGPDNRVSLPSILQRLTSNQPIADFYARCEQRGYAYGPAFRLLQELHIGDGEAIGRITAPSTSARYHLDPSLLDACFQVALTALPSADPSGLYVPSAIAHVRASRSIASGASIWSHVKTTPVHGLTFDVQLIAEDGVVVAEIEGLTFRRADINAMRGKQTTSWAEHVYDIAWQEQPAASPQGAQTELPWFDDLRDRVAASLRDSEHSTQAALARTLDERSVAHVLTALDVLGWKPKVGERFEVDALRQQLNVAPRHRQVFARMLEMVAESGRLHRRDGGWEVVFVRERTPLTPLAESEPELELLDRCGASLAGVLRGEIEALPLIFPGGDTSGPARLYGESRSFKAINVVLARAITAATSGVRGLRILELGAGTGATTSHLLPLLPPDTAEYLFTDLSPRFTTEAETRFAAFPFLRTQRLDIEVDPHDQGVELASYDIVLASNVVHATRDLSVTLANARKLLRPGGQLVLLEGTSPRAWIDLTFGLLEGWWRFEDRSLRANYPLLSATRWRELLGRQGFDRVIALEPDTNPALLGFPQSVIVARHAPEQMVEASGGRWLICGDQALSASIADRLRAQGKSILRMRSNETVDLGGTAFEGVIDCRPAELTTDADVETTADATRGGSHTWAAVLHLVQAVVPIGCGSVSVVTRGALSANARMTRAGVAQATITGLRKVVALEHPALKCRLIDADADQDLESQAANLAAEVLRESDEDEVAFRSGCRLVPRLEHRGEPVTSDTSASTRIEKGATATLDALRLTPSARRAPGPGEVEMSVRASGLNFLDVLDALGVLPFARPEGLGLECAGDVLSVGEGVTSVAPGDRVMAIAGGSLARYVIAPAALTARVPDGIGDETAATTPIAFLTAAHALRSVANLRSGQRVLIHAAAGGTGLAAVQIAMAAGAEVFATASPWKWDTLRAMGVRHLASSRTLDFSQMVLRQTGGQGVDVVLNSLAGETIEASFACLAEGGHFVELGKTRILDAAEVATLRPQVRYTAVDLRDLCLNNAERIAPMFRQVVNEIGAGTLKALPVEVFSATDATNAFRFMQLAKHVGKLALTWPRGGADVPVRRDGTYLITGGTGGLGLRIAEWLASQGAGRIVLMARRADGVDLETQLDAIRSSGAHVEVVRGDASLESDIARTLAGIASSGSPLRGVLHAAGTLDDGVLIEQSADRFARVMAAKVSGAWHLHRLTSQLPLDFFVLFSSTASLFGSAGQANHAAANAYMDALAHHRRSIGLPGLSINWGAWGEIGAAATASARGFMQSHGLLPLDPQHGIAALGYHLGDSSRAQIGVAAVDWRNFFARRAPTPFFADHAAPAAVAADEENVLATLRAAPREEQAGILRRFLRQEVAQVLGITNLERIGVDRGFFELGMDSLTSVEFRNHVQIKLGCRLSETVAFDFPTIDALAQHLVEMQAPDAPAIATELDRVQSLSTTEAMEQLERELAALE